MIDVLVPVLGRPVYDMLRTLEDATTTPFQVYLICSPQDSQTRGCQNSGYTTWVVPWEPGRADFARKINWAFARTKGEWVFQGADDIRFSLGWDVEALRVAERYGASVIGTNDLHNPSVKRRIHSTHTLFRRSYIEEQGGTFDGTGPVFSEAYDHQFVDNELIELAKSRGLWAFADQSVVEHLHPVWGLAEWDPTYEKAFRETAGDTALFASRSRLLKQ